MKKTAKSATPAPEFDAIVIGSGVSGGFAAKELTERGLKTLMLDRGHMQEHGDYPGEGKGPWEVPFAGKVPAREIESEFFITKFGYPDQYNRTLYNNDRQNPYDLEDGKRFHWIRPAAFGGKSLIWGRVSLRWSAMDFEANKKDGHGLDWPIRYEDLAPWYSKVEQFVGISGNAENLPQLPDSDFMPPMPMNVAERWVKSQIETKYDRKRIMTNIRVANITQDKPEQGRSKCQFRSQCSRGCSFGAYFSTQSTTLPVAMATGNLTVMADSVVESLEYDPATRKVTGVRVVNTKTLERKVLRSKIVYMCASTIGTLQILMNSRGEGHATGLGNSSGLLGHYIMDHMFRSGAGGVVPGFTDKVEYGRRPGGIYIPRFRNLAGQDGDADFVRGYGFQGGARRSDPRPTAAFGAELKQQMRVPGPWTLNLGGFGECLPYKDNVAKLHPTKVDRFGIPQMTFNVEFKENERRMVLDMHRQAIEMLKGAGMKNVGGVSNVDDQTPGRAIHEMGGACMGKSPRTSVTNKWSQLHDVSNVFIGDGAQMTSASCVNPSLTFMALTMRSAQRAADLVRDGAI